MILSQNLYKDNHSITDRKSMSIPLPTGTCEASGDLHTAKIKPTNPTIEKGIFSNVLFENIP